LLTKARPLGSLASLQSRTQILNP